MMGTEGACKFSILSFSILTCKFQEISIIFTFSYLAVLPAMSSYQSPSAARGNQEKRVTHDFGNRTVKRTFLLDTNRALAHTSPTAQTYSTLDIPTTSTRPKRYYSSISTSTPCHRHPSQSSTASTYSSPTYLHPTISSTSASSSSDAQVRRLSGTFNAPTDVEIERSRPTKRSFRKGVRSLFSF
jgi:hypothetical protein